jgi:acyl carrier protein
MRDAAAGARVDSKVLKADCRRAGTVLAPTSVMDKAVAAGETEPDFGEPTRWKRAVSELAEARLRQLVAERLGIGAEQLSTDAALDDLGADEMDLLEIAVALEEEFGLVVSDAVLGRVRTYGDLSDSFGLLLRDLANSGAEELLPSGIVRVRVIRSPPDDGGAVLRAARLTRRVIESIIEEVLWTAGVTRLDLSCSADTTDRQLAHVAQRLAWLRNRGIQVSVERIGQTMSAPAETARHATGGAESHSVVAHACDEGHTTAYLYSIGFVE